MPSIDLNLAKSYLDYLAHDREGWTFQTFDDSEKKRAELARVFNVSVFSAVADALVKLNGEGAGIFVTVNRTDGKGRKIENVIALRAVFVDGDDLPVPDSWHETPDIFTKRDDKHWHAYWRVRSDTPLDAFENVQRRLAAFYGTDPGVHDLPRVMRVPGFLHRKGEAVELTMELAGAEYVRTLDEVMQGIPPLVVEQPPQVSAPAFEPVAAARPRHITPSASTEDTLIWVINTRAS